MPEYKQPPETVFLTEHIGTQFNGNMSTGGPNNDTLSINETSLSINVDEVPKNNSSTLELVRSLRKNGQSSWYMRCTII